MIYRRDFDTLIAFLKRHATEQEGRDEGGISSALRDAAANLEQLYNGMTTSQYVERYRAAVRRLAAVRTAYRSLQIAYDRRGTQLREEGERRRARERVVEMLEAERAKLKRDQATLEAVNWDLRNALLDIARTRHDSDVFMAHQRCWTIAEKSIDRGAEVLAEVLAERGR